MDSFDFKRLRSKLPEVYPEWADIPGDVLRYIVSKTRSIQDYIRIAAVCRSWQAYLKDVRKPEFPICLMVGEREGVDWFFCTASHDRFIRLALPETKGGRCWGSPFGWLITYGGVDFKIQLFNPLSRLSFQLPSLQIFHSRRAYPPYPWLSRVVLIDKVLLSSPPTSPDCIVMAIYSTEKLLAFTKPGYHSWTPIDTPSPLHDINCFNGDFFAVDNSGQLFICRDLNGPSPKAVEFAEPPPGSAARTKHIVDLGGHLCMIVRKLISPYSYTYFGGNYQTGEFEMFKLDMSTREWRRIWSLGDRSLFIGIRGGFSVVAATDPGGCKPNCIYYVDDYQKSFGGVTNGLYRIGRYNCDNKAVDFLHDPQHLAPYFFARPLWMKPSSH